MVFSSKQGEIPKTLKKGKVLETVGSGKEQPTVLCNKPKQFIYRELRIIVGEQKYKTKGQAYEVVGL